ncbi:MAG: hypothetical protein IKA22_05880 [Lentisphaeria bacterium]|nr:hypothetical protein [Lentisphaeria bacterium]
MKKHIIHGFFAALCALLFCGCASLETLEESDLTIAELEEKMEKAMDPSGAFRRATSYVQREMLKIEGVFFDDIYQIDLKYKKPDFLRLTTLENNQPISGVIYNAGSAWQVDYNEKKVKEITGADLIRLNMLHKLTTPTEKYSQIFKEIKVFRCKFADDDGEYYKIVCNPANKKNTVSVYVDANDFLPRRIDADLTVIFENKPVEFESSCVIESYELMDGVMIPQKAVSVSNGIESTTTVFDYKLNVNIPDSEFLPPVFTENKLRNRMDRFYNDSKDKRGFRRRNRRD